MTGPDFRVSPAISCRDFPTVSTSDLRPGIPMTPRRVRFSRWCPLVSVHSQHM